MNLYRVRPLALVVALALLASACSDDPTDDGEAVETETTTAVTTLWL